MVPLSGKYLFRFKRAIVISQFVARRHNNHFELIPENLFNCRSYILLSLSAVILPPQSERVNRALETGPRYL
jgi:hypothetical protein